MGKATWNPSFWGNSLVLKFCSHKVIQYADISMEGCMSLTLSETPRILSPSLMYHHLPLALASMVYHLVFGLISEIQETLTRIPQKTELHPDLPHCG